MTSVFVAVAILAALALCYWLARERFDAVTSALAVGGVAVGGPIAWHALGPVDADFAIRLILGTVAVVLRSRLQTRLTDLPAAALAVALGLAAMLPWIDGPVSVAGLTPAEGLWSSRAGPAGDVARAVPGRARVAPAPPLARPPRARWRRAPDRGRDVRHDTRGVVVGSVALPSRLRRAHAVPLVFGAAALIDSTESVRDASPIGHGQRRARPAGRLEHHPDGRDA